MAEIIPIRRTLYGNIQRMLAYAEQELQSTERDFVHKYEHGFIYGHNCDYIAFRYNHKSHTACVRVSHYDTTLEFRNDKVVEYSNGREKEITQSYLTNTHWCNAKELQQAAEITMHQWQTIKCVINAHKAEDNAINNFSI